MRRIADLSIPSGPSGRLLLIALFVILTALSGCGAMKTVTVLEPAGQQGPPLEEDIQRNDFSAARGDSLIGRLATVRLEKDDTLPDVARHFGLGINAISAANPGVDMWVPEAGRKVILPLSFILPDARRKGIVINLAAMRLFLFKGGGRVATYPVGVGAEDRPTPMGQMYVKSKTVRPTWHVPASIAERYRKKGDPLPEKVPPGPKNPLGEYAMYLSRPGYLVHGTNKPASIGLQATNGCIRLYPEDIQRLYESTPVNTPVSIVNQPYLVGQSGGVVYIEVHANGENADKSELNKMFAKLKGIEKKSARPVDWGKVKQALAEARGVPVSVSGVPDGSGKGAEIAEVRHPAKLYGRPEVPELKMGAWYVLAGDMPHRENAMRLAAIINHQGPQIPARVITRKNDYRVIAGPFKDMADAKEAVKRLKIDLELEGRLIELKADVPGQ